MSENKYCVVYRALPSLGQRDYYIAKHNDVERTSILSLSRLTTQKPEYIAVMSLSAARNVASAWDYLDQQHSRAEVVPAPGTSQEVIDEEEALQYPEPDAIALALRSEAVRLQPAEKVALDHLTEFWNAYSALPYQLDMSQPHLHDTVRNAVHAIQGAIAMRVAKRADPDVWR